MESNEQGWDWTCSWKKDLCRDQELQPRGWGKENDGEWLGHGWRWELIPQEKLWSPWANAVEFLTGCGVETLHHARKPVAISSARNKWGAVRCYQPGVFPSLYPRDIHGKLQSGGRMCSLPAPSTWNCSRRNEINTSLLVVLLFALAYPASHQLKIKTTRIISSC